MKKIYSLASLVLIGFTAQAQVAFWTEDFGNGCNRGQLGSAYTGTNGAWSEATTGTNDGHANIWFVSATAAGTAVGTCSASCLFGNVTNQALHIGNPAVVIPSFVNIGADTGSTYLTGAFCGFGICSITNKRIQSPTINCTGQTNISATFLYYEGTEAVDNATFEYSADGGITWTQADVLAKTPTACPAPAGTWTSITVALPASADNNANVKIGFNWTNDAANGTDPSFAVDDITLTGGPSGMPLTLISELSLFAAGNGQITIHPNGQTYKVLGIYDMLGQEVQFVNTNNTVQMSNSTPGIYIITLEVDGVRVTRKLMMN